MNASTRMPRTSAADCVRHLTTEAWAEVNRDLVAKTLGEFAHELLIEPMLVLAADGSSWYTVDTDQETVKYRFRATRMELDHWWLERASIRRLDGGAESELSAERLILDLRQRLAISDHVLPEYLQEISSSLFAAAYKREEPRLDAAALAPADFQELESGMTEGHPIFVANNARVGFNALDYQAFAPETAAVTRLVWLAARAERVRLACVRGLAYRDLLRNELGEVTLAAFERELEGEAGGAAAFVLIPVHPWQWENRIQQLFAADLALGELIFLGYSADVYQPQQSIRTLFNQSRPERAYVKTALSIVNMGFSRGMPASIAGSAMAVNDWLGGLVEGDPFLRAAGFSLLREIGHVGYLHRHYEPASRARHEPYKEMLAAQWRESPVPRLAAGERLMTMAALLHVDRRGDSLLAALIRRSGVAADDWLHAYLKAYLTPLLHCFYAHRLTFTPHCENVILVLEGDVPKRIFIKDLAEDVAVLNAEVALPDSVRRIGLTVPEEVMTLVIFTDVFDCVFRFLVRILSEHLAYPEARFWRLVADCIHDYQRARPELDAAFRKYDLFAPTFIRNCLNRLQLRNNRQMVDLNAPEPVDSLQFVGTLNNPVAPFADANENARGLS